MDDLDRCSDAYASEIVTALYTMSRASPNPVAARENEAVGPALAALVLCDSEWLESALASQIAHEDAGAGTRPGKSIGHSYLEKIFVGAIELPRLSSVHRKQLVRGASSSPNPAREAQSRTERLRVHSSPTNQFVSNTDPSTESTIRLMTREHSAEGVAENKDSMHRTIENRSRDIAMLAEAEARLIEDFAHLMEPTARGVKRTMILFWLNRAVAHALPGNESLTDEKIMRWTIAKARWPTLIEQLAVIDHSEWRERAQQILGKQLTELDEVIPTTMLDEMSIALLP